MSTILSRSACAVALGAVAMAGAAGCGGGSKSSDRGYRAYPRGYGAPLSTGAYVKAVHPALRDVSAKLNGFAAQVRAANGDENALAPQRAAAAKAVTADADRLDAVQPPSRAADAHRRMVADIRALGSDVRSAAGPSQLRADKARFSKDAQALIASLQQ